MLLIDKYAYTNRLRNLSPGIKASIGAIFLIASMLFKNLYILIGNILFMSFIIVVVAKIDFKSYINILKIPMYFLLMGVGMNLLNISVDGKELLYGCKFFSFYIGISRISIDTSIHILFRAISCLTCVYFFMLTTPFNQLIFLLKKLHLPDNLIEVTMLIYRFIFILLEEVSDIKKSQELRFGYVNLKTSYKSLGILVNLLYRRIMKRYDDMCVSLDIKLYDGKFHIIGDEHV
ncbi:cobalt ECF transporter T component CbiQ [Asaccharospora irregularis]|uniref:Cobalt/nickel transport system permease protein n=1 Tax=Asaccharospora irregularis DSM 2635 TaxID=1121321 RepID=A0A1M5QZM8_9FIRM|nr:cobalt ECF transporter T component CbiQ [Asaccharospora irregularis]SHH19381.1 cobalt/nickel transport system permease protein [Asaccharospora irregularis DSM 2635]